MMMMPAALMAKRSARVGPRLLLWRARSFETQLEIPDDLKKYIPPPIEDYPPELLVKKTPPAPDYVDDEERVEVTLQADGDLPEVSLLLNNIKFTQHMYVHAGKWMPMPEAHQLGEYKIKARIKMEHFELEPMAERRLAYMLGPRYNPDKHLVSMKCEKFRSRVENKRYLTYQLLQLKQAAIPPDPEFDSSYEREQEELAIKKANWFNH